MKNAYCSSGQMQVSRAGLRLFGQRSAGENAPPRADWPDDGTAGQDSAPGRPERPRRRCGWFL